MSISNKNVAVTEDDDEEYEDYEIDIYRGIARNLNSYSGFDAVMRELLQNSDDSLPLEFKDKVPVTIDIRFYDDKLVIKNNTVFTKKDWEKIRIIGAENKENDPNKTGRFGIGFTAIFKICDYLRIHSKNMSKELDLNIKGPKKWRKIKPAKYQDVDVTEFEFFWRFKDSEARRLINADIVHTTDIIKFINAFSNTLDKDITFLKNTGTISLFNHNKLIKKITIEKHIEELSDDIKKELRTVKIDNDISKRIIYRKLLSDHFQEEAESRLARLPLELSICINKNKLKSGSKSGVIYCTLPTEIATGFKFDINSDFIPDPNRKDLIWDIDDSKGRYNKKIMEFLPEFLFEILEDIKIELNPRQLYQLLSNPCSEADSKIYDFIHDIYEQFISEIKSNDSEIIFIYDEWRPISSTKFMQQTSIVPFLTRLKYPIIPEEYSQFEILFKELCIEDFKLQDLIKLLLEKIPSATEFDNSIFESYKEYLKIIEYMSRYINQLPQNEYEKYQLNIIPVEGTDHKIILDNIKESKIFYVPEVLNDIKKELGTRIIDNKTFARFDTLFTTLGCKQFDYNDLVEILYCDFKDYNPIIRLDDAPSYINTKEKMLLIIEFIRPYLKFISTNNQGLKTGIFFDTRGNKVMPKTKDWTTIRESVNNFGTLPLILDDNNCLNRINNDRVYDLHGLELREFAGLHELVNIDADINKSLLQYFTIPKLDIDRIIDLINIDIKSKKLLNDEYLILIYKLLLLEKQNIKGNVNLIKVIKSLHIFKNSRNEFTSLIEDNREIFFQGEYTVPIEIGQVLNEKLIQRVPGFKEYVLSESLGIKKLTFDLLIKRYFIEIFNNTETPLQNKLVLIDELNKFYDDIITNDVDNRIEEILQKSKIVYCQDDKFHSISEGNIYFKSDEIDEILNKEYFWPCFKNLDKYEHMLKAIGMKSVLPPEKIVQYIKVLSGRNVNQDLIKHLKIIFVHINTKWDEYNPKLFNKNPFTELANINWLPAANDNNNLFKPSHLYTQNSKEQLQNTKLLLWCLPDIRYLDILDADLTRKDGPERIKADFIKVLGLNDVPRIPTQKIVENLKIASKNRYELKNSKRIYQELNSRVDQATSIDSINELKKFPSIYKKYEYKQPKYCYPNEVFRSDSKKEKFGTKYVEFLSPEFVGNYQRLLDRLNVLNEPNSEAILSILQKIQDNYKINGYKVDDTTDIKILINCFKELDQLHAITINIEKISKMNIICNIENVLIKPSEAIFIDRPSLQKDIGDDLKQYLVPYKEEFISLFDKIGVTRVSKIIRKDIQNIPDINGLDTDKKATNRLNHFASLIQRIIAQKSDLEIDKWRNFDSEFKVYLFSDLIVEKYIEWAGNRHSLKGNIGQCYMEIEDSLIKYALVKDIINEENIWHITSELNEALHPDLNIDFRAIIDYLLRCNTLTEMEYYLTRLDFPEIEKANTTTIAQDEEKEEIFYDNEDYESSAPISLTKDITEECIPKPITDGGQSIIISQNDKKPLRQKHPHKSQENDESEDAIDSNSDGIENESKSTDKSNDRKTRQRGQDVQNKQNEHKKKNTHPMNYLGIYELDVPLSEEEEQEEQKKIEEILNDAYTSSDSKETIRYYKSIVVKAGNKTKEATREELYVWYEGACQFQDCNKTFRSRSDGRNYFEIYLINKPNIYGGGGIVFPGNALCLCAEHKAKMEHGWDAPMFEYDKIRDNKLELIVCGQNSVLEFNKEHIKYIRSYFEPRDE